MKKQQSGFTMIELIMVIVILGILAAVAIPRFANLGGDARQASIEAVAGSMRSASAIVHSAWLAAGNAAATTVTVEGVDVAVDTFGYPTTAGIMDAIQLDGNLTVSGGTVSADGAPGTCSATYAPAVITAGALTTAPAVTTVVTGC